MNRPLQLASLAAGPLAHAACTALGLPIGAAAGEVVGFLSRRFSDQSQRLTEALRKAHDRAWSAIELSLAGDSWWQKCKARLSAAEDRALRDQIRSFIEQAQPDSTQTDELRRAACDEFRQARRAGLLQYSDVPPDRLAFGCAEFSRFSDPLQQVEAQREAVGNVAAELTQAQWRDKFLTTWLVHDSGRIVGWTFVGNLMYAQLPP